MTVCFVCRKETTAHVVRALTSEEGPRAWARVCVPCAIKYDLDGVLLSGPSDREIAQEWLAYQRGKHGA